MKMEEAGLIDYWWRRFSAADPTPCLSENIIKEENKNNKSERRNKRLTFKGLSGAFVILVAGYILSWLAFIIECSIARIRKQNYAIIIPTEDVKQKQKDVKATNSKIDAATVTADMNQENDLQINSSGDSKIAEKNKVDDYAGIISPPNEISNNQNIMKIDDLMITDMSEEDISHENKEVTRLDTQITKIQVRIPVIEKM